MQSVGKPGNDLVLHVEEIGDSVVKTVRPQVRTDFRIHELNIHPKAIPVPLDRSFEHISHTQFLSDLPEISRLPFVGERSVPPDHKRAPNAGQVRGQALGYAIGEVVLRGIVAEVGKGQHNDGQMRR